MDSSGTNSKINRSLIRVIYLLGTLLFLGPEADTVRAQTSDLTERTPVSQENRAYGTIGATVSAPTVITKPGNRAIERGFVDVSVPEVLDTNFVDNARLILTVSTVFDSTEPLIIAAFPATVDKATRPAEWSVEWNEMSGGFDPEYIAITSVESTEDAIEIAIDVTQFVRLWQAGTIPNRGIVIKTLSEDKSTFHWIRDGRYDGQDAKLEIWYSRKP